MKKLFAVAICFLLLSGCAGKGSYINMEIPMPDGRIATVEASGDTLVQFDPATGKWEFLTEQIKEETVSMIGKQMEALWSILGGS